MCASWRRLIAGRARVQGIWSCRTAVCAERRTLRTTTAGSVHNRYSARSSPPTAREFWRTCQAVSLKATPSFKFPSLSRRSCSATSFLCTAFTNSIKSLSSLPRNLGSATQKDRKFALNESARSLFAAEPFAGGMGRRFAGRRSKKCDCTLHMHNVTFTHMGHKLPKNLLRLRAATLWRPS